MIYKYTKCESVIAKIMADSDMQEKDIRISDIREWIFEAVEKIGAPMQYIQKESGSDGFPILKVQDHQVPIPEDLQHLNAVAYSTNEDGPWVPARTETGQFKSHPVKCSGPKLPIGPMYDLDNLVIDRPEYCIEQEDPKQPMRYKLPTTQSQFYEVNLTKYADKNLDVLRKDVTFFTKPGWIVLNRKDGYVKLSYKAIAVDERGYPLIPDLASYQEAIYWYVMMKLSFPKYLQGKLGGSISASQKVYFYLHQQWNFYRNQAYAEAMMPTESDMRSIKNEWNKLIPEWDSDDTFFKGVGRRQLNYNDYYYGY